MKWIWIAIIGFVTQTSHAQYEVKPDSLSRAMVAKADFLVGRWEGDGWVLTRQGGKQVFQQTEVVAMELGGTLMTIRGRGRQGSRTTHDAFGIVTYSKKDSALSIQTFHANGRGGVFSCQAENGRFTWFPDSLTRFIIILNDQPASR